MFLKNLQSLQENTSECYYKRDSSKGGIYINIQRGKLCKFSCPYTQCKG